MPLTKLLHPFRATPEPPRGPGRPKRPRGDARGDTPPADLLAAQAEFLELRRQQDEEARRERQELAAREARIVSREERLQEKLDLLEQKALRLQDKVAELGAAEETLAAERATLAKERESLAGMSRAEAETQVLAGAEEAMRAEIVRRVRKLEAQGREELERKASLLLASVLQRYAASHVAENSTSVVNLPNDDVKGRIIGKEGRNIRALESATGCEILVDETPGQILISGFNPLRREVAKRSLERLLADGRIQPTRIEEVVAQVKKEMNEEMHRAGEEVAYDLGITEFPAALLQLLGRLRYRTSYGQSILQHSWEAAKIASQLARELGADAGVVKRATLLHDLGKAVDHEVEGTHVEIGDELMKTYGVSETVRKAAAAHHEDYPFETLEAFIVQIADAISAARPGARKESYGEYVKRLSDLEAVATSFEGVEKAYAIAAGREVRVIVEPKLVDDRRAIAIAQGIAAKIEHELKYPGEVKVNVIRETRAEATAR